MICATDEFVCREGDDIRVVTVSLEIMIIVAILPFLSMIFLAWTERKVCTANKIRRRHPRPY